MTAVSFLQRKVSVKVNPITSYAKRTPIKPKHEFNYSVISLLNMDVIDALSVFAKNGIIENKALEGFEEKGYTEDNFTFNFKVISDEIYFTITLEIWKKTNL